MDDFAYLIVTEATDAEAPHSLRYPGAEDAPLPPSLEGALRLERDRAPFPGAASLTYRGLDPPDAAGMSGAEAQQARRAYARLRERCTAAHARLLAAEEAFQRARNAWQEELDAAAAEYRPVHRVLAGRRESYWEQHHRVAEESRRNARLAEEQRSATLEARRDEVEGPRTWAVKRFTWPNRRAGAAGEAEELPLARRAQEFRPLIHRASCASVTCWERPVDEEGVTDWGAEPEKRLRPGVALVRLPAVLEILAEGGPACYRSQGRLYENRSVPRLPARLCHRCGPLPAVIAALGERGWGQWQAEHPEFAYGAAGEP